MESPPAPARRPARKPPAAGGRLRIGDDWSAISIIALSQENPLKAVAEFVENSIDAGARSISITRGRERGEHYLEVADDGRGVPRDADGRPDFRYVATHICDSVKRRLKADGARGIQGEFGIGLLSFWTVGEELAMSCPGADGRLYEMRLRKGDPGYSVARKGTLLAEGGTRLKVRPLLPGVRQLSGEIYVELYLTAADAANEVGLYRSGTRILRLLTELEAFQKTPWSEACLQGIVDVPFLNLTPATRSGVIHDAALEEFAQAMAPPGAGGPGSGAAAGATNGVALPEDAEGASPQRQFFEFAGPLFGVRIAPSACTVAVGAARGLHALARDASRRRIAEGDLERNLIVVNSGHRDFVFASRAKALKLRYLVRLYSKEMVRKNFPGLRGEELLDRLIELSLYAEEHLR